MTADAIRIGNCSGFYGDRFSAVREMLEGGPLDYLTGDYLAELTMLILGKDRMKSPDAGYAKTFLRQMEDGLGLALDKGVRIVTNAGGLNPAGLAAALRALADRFGLDAKIAYVAGDDLLPRAAELGLGHADRTGPLTANAYLGAWGIAACLDAGADVVVTGRVTDASVVVGPAAHHFGWARDVYDALAGAVVAGHIIECSAQATGGNFSYFTEIDMRRPGFPIAEVRADGSSIITKHPGTGGAVTVDTVTAQLLYEIGGHRYAGPDVTTRFDTIELSPEEPDRVLVHNTRGEPPPPQLKVCLNTLGGFRNMVAFVLTGLEIDAKAELVKTQMTEALGANAPKEIVWTLARTAMIDADTEQDASALLYCVAKDPQPDPVGRSFSNAAVELALASYPGFTLTAPPGTGSPYGVYTAGYVDAKLVDHTAVLPDGTTVAVDAPGDTLELAETPAGELPRPLPGSGATKRVPLGTVVAARSGDKGGAANVGVWARSDDAWRWLAHFLTVEEFARLMPEAAPLPISRHVFGNLRALNFVVDGLLGEGVSSGTRFDPQGKGLGEWLRSRYVDIPEELL